MGEACLAEEGFEKEGRRWICAWRRLKMSQWEELMLPRPFVEEGYRACRYHEERDSAIDVKMSSCAQYTVLSMLSSYISDPPLKKQLLC